MKSTLRVLHVEDSEKDVVLLTRYLSRAGYELISKRVDTAPALRATLETSEWDVLLCDYSMPRFNALAALEILKELKLDIPFIVISGTVGETVAVEAMRSGAHDYLMKDNLVRLSATLQRELQEAENRRARRRAEEALKTSEGEMRALFEAMTDVILVFDRDGRYLKVAPSRPAHVYKPAAERVGQTLHEMFPQDQADFFLSHIHQALAEGKMHRHEYELEIAGQPMWFEGSVSPMSERSVVWIARDITERKLAERRLKKANQNLEDAVTELRTKGVELASMTQQLWQASKLATMGELSASIAHELNNPLATVALRTESLLMRLPEDSEQRKPLEIITQEVDRMAVLVNNLLQFSRRSHRQISTLDPRDEITNSLELVHYHLRTRKVEVVRKFAAELPTIQADRQQLRQLFLNLLTNASDAMPEGGKLTVCAALDGASATAVALEFADNGNGIAAENLERIWDPFFTTKPEGKGTGLGLAICRRIVEEHGGTIEIRSQLGRGTTVKMVFPATNTEAFV